MSWSIDTRANILPSGPDRTQKMSRRSFLGALLTGMTTLAVEPVLRLPIGRGGTVSAATTTTENGATYKTTIPPIIATEQATIVAHEGDAPIVPERVNWIGSLPLDQERQKVNNHVVATLRNQAQLPGPFKETVRDLVKMNQGAITIGDFRYMVYLQYDPNSDFYLDTQFGLNTNPNSPHNGREFFTKIIFGGKVSDEKFQANSLNAITALEGAMLRANSYKQVVQEGGSNTEILNKLRARHPEIIQQTEKTRQNDLLALIQSGARGKDLRYTNTDGSIVDFRQQSAEAPDHQPSDSIEAVRSPDTNEPPTQDEKTSEGTNPLPDETLAQD